MRAERESGIVTWPLAGDDGAALNAADSFLLPRPQEPRARSGTTDLLWTQRSGAVMRHEALPRSPATSSCRFVAALSHRRALASSSATLALSCWRASAFARPAAPSCCRAREFRVRVAGARPHLRVGRRQVAPGTREFAGKLLVRRVTCAGGFDQLLLERAGLEFKLFAGREARFGCLGQLLLKPARCEFELIEFRRKFMLRLTMIGNLAIEPQGKVSLLSPLRTKPSNTLGPGPKACANSGCCSLR